MKLHFEPDLDFQLQAVDAICGLFRGQEICQTEFSVSTARSSLQKRLSFIQNDLGVGNRLALLDDEILTNLNSIQMRNDLLPSASLVSGDFTVEMETGTGKTYVYLRTIFELNKRYRFTKFIIVVPSVAVKEGVYKTLQVTEDHFRTLYSGTPFEYFVYDSAKLGQVRNFATSAQIQIMVVTVGAINKKDVNNLYKDSERMGGEKPIDIIRAIRPILIVDEPQSVDGGLDGRGKKAIDSMNPLCTFRYSATHVDKHHMVYRLNAIDAYERKLVKQVEIASATVQDTSNSPYVRLISTSNRRGAVSARIEVDVEVAGRVRRTERWVEDGDDLEQTTGRAIYRNCRVGEIRAGKLNAFLELRVPGGECFLRKGDAWGDVDSAAIQRQMIRRTIHEHFDKEKRLRPQGIKVLSLFFIDSVERYRRYDEDGNAIKGEYALIFEEEYRRLAKHPDYQSQFSELGYSAVAEDVHDGYFSIDKKGGWTDTSDNNQTNRDNAGRAYNLIMRDKEKLLRLEEPLKFIFSHSALREGWDNPNVFQICALRDIQTERERRQTIGRGLRLCVDQDGRRQHGFAVNTLTVIARESYEEFAEKLQREIEEETGVRFGIIEPHQFAQLPPAGDGSLTLGLDKSKKIFDHLLARGYIDCQGRIEDCLRKAVRDDSLHLPEELSAHRAGVVSVLRRFSGRIEIKNADERRAVRPRQAVLDSKEFKALWNRIKHKTTYRLNFDNEALLNDSANALRSTELIPRARLKWRKADLSIGQSGIQATAIGGEATVVLEHSDIELPNVLTELQDRTNLTRRSICKILIQSGRLEEFKFNPQKFIELAAQVINACKQRALVDGIKYHRIGEEAYFAQELFKEKELTGYLRNIRPSEKSIYDGVIYESSTEAQFAEDLEKNADVKVYAKLPRWFRVPTPIGKYSPDWAVLLNSEDGEKLYFVVETKGSTSLNDLRYSEAAKMKCCKAHFLALTSYRSSVRYEVVSSVDQLLARRETS